MDGLHLLGAEDPTAEQKNPSLKPLGIFLLGLAGGVASVLLARAFLEQRQRERMSRPRVVRYIPGPEKRMFAGKPSPVRVQVPVFEATPTWKDEEFEDLPTWQAT